MLKASQIAAKVITRLFFILLLIAVVPFMQGDNHKMQNLYFTTAHKWVFAFPIILIIGFIALLVFCTIKKYKEVDMKLVAGAKYDDIVSVWNYTVYTRLAFS